MSAVRIVRIEVRGRVQGVGYRAFVEHEAVARKLGGWVRNRRDGTVEAVAAGPSEVVTSLIDVLRKGPPAARVEAVHVIEADEGVLTAERDGFSILPTI